MLQKLLGVILLIYDIQLCKALPSPPALPNGYNNNAAGLLQSTGQHSVYVPANPPAFPNFPYQQKVIESLDSPDFVSKVSLDDLTKLDSFNAFDITGATKIATKQAGIGGNPPAVPNSKPPAVPDKMEKIPRIADSVPMDKNVEEPKQETRVKPEPEPLPAAPPVAPPVAAKVSVEYQKPRSTYQAAPPVDAVHYGFQDPYANLFPSFNNYYQNYNQFALPPAPASPPVHEPVAAIAQHLPPAYESPVALPAVIEQPVMQVQPAIVERPTVAYTPPHVKSDVLDYINEYNNVENQEPLRAIREPMTQNLVPLYPPDLMAGMNDDIKTDDPIKLYKAPTIYNSAPLDVQSKPPQMPVEETVSLAMETKVVRLPLATSVSMPTNPPPEPEQSPPEYDHISFETESEDRNDEYLNTDDVLTEIENYTFDFPKDIIKEKPVSIDQSAYPETEEHQISSTDYVHTINDDYPVPKFPQVHNSAPLSKTTENNAPYARQADVVKESVDCIMNPWTPWSDCSRTCGGGIQYRHRSIRLQNSHGGVNCPKSYEERTCNFKPCPVVDCEMNPWTPWSACSRSCDGGIQSRSRTIRQPPTVGGNNCPQSYMEQTCGHKQCSSDCESSQWQSWGSCSVACGQGVRKRARYITLQKRGDGEECPLLQEESSCFIPCPVDCLVSSWGEWTACSRSCAAGRRIRSRFIMQESRRGGQPCPTDLEQSETCNLHSCPWNEAVREYNSHNSDLGISESGPEISRGAPRRDDDDGNQGPSVLSFLKETLHNNPSLMAILNNGGHISPSSDSRVPVIVQKPIILDAPSNMNIVNEVFPGNKDDSDDGHLTLPRRLQQSVFENREAVQQARKSRSRSVRLNLDERRKSSQAETNTRTVPFDSPPQFEVFVPDPPAPVITKSPITDAPCKTLYCKRRLGLVGRPATVSGRSPVQTRQSERVAAVRAQLNNRLLRTNRPNRTPNSLLTAANSRRRQGIRGN